MRPCESGIEASRSLTQTPATFKKHANGGGLLNRGGGLC